nr:MAG TPA: endosialidase chaperone [Caudoviricetes sp.]
MKAKSLYIQKLAYDENTGNEIIGLFPSEANPAIVSSYTYDAKRMGGAPTLTATIYSSEPLQWKKEEFVEYNGDRFFASYTPNSTKDNSSRMWKSEITFTSRRELLDNTLFFDVVVDDVDTQNKDRYRSNQTKFTFGGTIHEFVARINSSMAYCGLYRPTDEHKGYYVVIDEGYGTDEVKEVSFEDQYLTDVLQLINTTFELDYYWDGSVCHVGKVQHDLTDTPIKYGSSDALISVSKENANYKIVDMITGYGSSDNLPYYYPNDDEFGEAIFDAKNIASEHVDVTLSDYLRYSKYNDNLVLFKSKDGKYIGNVDISILSISRQTSPQNLSQADNRQNPTVTCWIGVTCKVNVIKGQIIDFSKILFDFELLDFIQTKNNITNLSSATREINIYTPNHELYKMVSTNTKFGDTCNVEFNEDKTLYINIVAKFTYNCKVFKDSQGITDFHRADSWKVSFSGNIDFYLDTNSEYSWKNGDNYIPFDESGIYVNGIDSAKYVEYDYNFGKNDEGIYGFDKIYTGTEDDAVQVSVTGRKWIAPSSVLMPSIYRNTEGAERFYYALNNTHKLPSGSGYYEFVNLYKKGNPHQGTVTFDDIKPTINGIVNAEGQLFGEIADVAFDKEDSDVKDSDGNYIHSYFYIKLHKFNGDFGFDLFAHALASESAKINLIKSNGCPACSFVIYNQPSADNSKCYNCVSVDENGNLKPVRTDKNDYIFANASDAYGDKLNQDSTQKELWIAVQKDTSTLGIIMPNASAGFKPQKGDLFVITGIKPPKVLVTAAEKRLDDALIKHMSENNTDQFNYSVKFSRIFLQENPDFASKLNENAKLSIQIQGDSDSDGNLISHEVFVSNYSVKVDNDELAEVEIELVNSLEVTKSDTKQIIDAVKGETVKSLSSMVGGSNTNSFNASITDKMYLSKLKDDTANGTITFQKVQKFLQGLLVGGGSWTPDAEGRSHLITDYLEVRMKAIFEELVIKKTSTIGGKEIISPAGGVVAHKVEEVTVTYNNVSQKAYRCYFLAEQEGDAVDNDFAVGDQVRSESFNVRKGTYHKAGNHFYWRLVIGRDEDPVELEEKKYHYIDLSDTDCATASDVPAKGDVLNQCGNRTDVERQNCLIFSSVDTYSPSISLYHGINSYSFANREYVEYGVNKQTNKAFFNVYGDMYVGDRPTKENGYEGSSYIRYDSSTKQVSVKGKISAKSTVDGKELSQYFKKIADLQNQVDGAIETWFYDGVPTLENAPAISWKTDKDKEIHLGDLYYDNKTGKAYRFAKDSNTYKWTIITDTDIAKALSDARMAQETANGKMKVFSVQPTTPYQVGDIWVNATYPSDGSTYKNEVLRCQTNKAAGSQFAIGDWIKASKYTDDTVANAAKKAAENAQKAAQTAQTDITNLGKTVTDNKKEFDHYVTDGYLEPSEIAAMAQDSKRLEDDFAAAQKSYNEVKEAEVLKDTKELTNLNTAFATLTSAKTELVTYLSEISTNYNKADTNGKAAIVSAVGTKFTNFQSAYSAFYDKLGLANAYITRKIYGDLGVVIGDVSTYQYLKKVLADGVETEINGGLILTSLIALRDHETKRVESGINGVIDKTAKGNGIATWWGGYMNDGEVVGFDKKEDYSKQAATSLVRFDGSGYMANGAIWWGTDGKVHADPTSFIISEKNLGAYLTFFEPTWKAGSAGTSVADLVSLKPNAPFSKLGVSGDATFEGTISFHGIKLTYDSKNKAIKIDGNLYTTGGITAYGAGASTTGGGGLIASVISYARIIEGSYTDADLTSIPNAYAIKALSSRIDNIATELGGLNLSWNNITGKPSTFTPSAHTHKWTEITDRITKVSQLTNDKGYLTAHQSLASYYTKAEIDAKGYTTNKGTVTSVALTLPTGLTCATKTITTSGTFAISLASGYSIPTTAKQTAWDGAVSAKHTHSNKSVLDGITSTKVTCWDSAYDWYALITTDEETADGIINKWNEVVSFLANIAQTDTLSGIVDGINKSISDEVTRAKKAEGVNASGISTNKTNITTLQGYFTSGSAKKALQLTNTHKLWGNSFNGTADINGSIIVPDGKYISIGNIKMEYDATNKALKITNTTTNEVANLYTSGGVSAYGVGTSSSSGGGLNGSVKSYSNALKLTSESLSEIASAYSIKALDSRISSLEGGSATAISVSGSGNAVTSVTKDGTTISVVKGSTFLTSHQSLDGYVNAISVSGSGNAITSVSKSGKGITFTKGATFLTSHQSLANYYTKSSVDSLLSGKSAISHTHSVKINGVTKTIAATGGTAVDLGTYLTSHQSLNGYATQSWVKSQGYLTSHQDVSILNMANNRYYSNNAYGINMRNSDIIGVNSVYTNDLSEEPTEAILFCRSNGNYDGIRAANGVLYFSNNVVRTTSKYDAEYEVYHKGNLTKLSQLTNDKNFVTGSVSGQTITINGVSTTWQNTWRGITDSYSGTSTGTSLSQKGANSLYNALHNGYASSAGNSDTVDGYHASGLLTALSNSDKGISITVGGTTKSVSNISVNYASSAGNADTVDGYHATSGRTFNGNINWSLNWNDSWSDGTNKHPWYGFDHRYENTGPYSTTISDFYGMTIKTAYTLRLDFGTLLLNGNDATINGATTINNNLSVAGLINNKGILPTNYEVNNKGTNCYVSADALCSGITAITDSIPVDNLSIVYSNDNGTNWTNYNISNDTKFKAYANVAGVDALSLGGNVITGNNDAEKLAQIKKNQLMFTFDVPNNCYSQVYFACVDMGQGVGVTCTVEYLNSKGVIVNTYIKYMTGWNQFNYINLSDGNTALNVGNDNRRYIRFKFKHDQNTTELRNASINKIRIFAFTKYSFPTDRFMGHTGHIYNFDYNMNTYFPNSILAKGGVTAYQSSDVRLKTNIAKLNCLNVIKSIGGTYEFDYLRDHKHSIGFIAQHVNNPLLKDIIAKDKDGYLKINYWSPKLISLAFGALTEIDNEVDKLKARVRELENEVEYLKNKAYALQ